jgi:hypothetical protein
MFFETDNTPFSDLYLVKDKNDIKPVKKQDTVAKSVSRKDQI